MKITENSQQSVSDLPVSIWEKKIVLTVGDKICLLIGCLTLLPLRIIILIPSLLLI
jgi:1-acyl-sn-glycerol-3-phosphate acyltransferase